MKSYKYCIASPSVNFKVTGHKMILSPIPEQGFNLVADVETEGTAGMKRASCRQSNGIGHIIVKYDPFFLLFRLLSRLSSRRQLGNGGKQRSGIGMERPFEKF